jgi:hypothetical protein
MKLVAFVAEYVVVDVEVLVPAFQLHCWSYLVDLNEDGESVDGFVMSPK